MLVNQTQTAQSSHLKAATTHNTNNVNYFSNLQTAPGPSMPESGTAMSLGRATGKTDTESTEGRRTTAGGGKGILA